MFFVINGFWERSEKPVFYKSTPHRFFGERASIQNIKSKITHLSTMCNQGARNPAKNVKADDYP